MAEEGTIGSIGVEVVPNAKGFWKDFEAQTRSEGSSVGDDIGESVAAPIRDKVSKSVSEGLSAGGAAAGEQGSKQGSSFADAFDKQMSARLDAALKNLPDASIDADLTPAQAKLDELRATLLGLSDAAYIELNVDDKTTLAHLAAVQAELEELTKPEHDIRVRVNAGAAATELAALQAQIDKLGKGPGGKGPGNDLGGIGADAEGAGASIGEVLIPALGAVATTIGPIAAVAVGAFGTILLGAQGLKDEVETGLEPAFKGLQATAVDALGPGIHGAIDELAEGLPKLNPLVTFFGQQIGIAADQFATWLNNGGFTGFVNYAEHELPIVESAFISITKAGVEFFNVVTPLGNDLLTVITKTADGINEIETALGQATGHAGNSPSSRSTAGSQVGYAFSTSGGYAPKPKTTGDYFSGIFHDISTFVGSGGSPTGSENGQRPKAASNAPSLADLSALQAHSVALQGYATSDINDSSALANRANQFDAAASAMAKANTEAAELAQTLPRLNAQELVAGPSTLALAQAMDKFGTSQGGVADKAALLGQVLVSSQGDALSYAGALANGYNATQQLVSTFQQQASATQSTAGTVNATKQSAALDRVTAATSRLNAAQIKAGSPQKTAADAASAAAAVASAQATLTTANSTLDKASQATGGVSASQAFADTEKAAIDLNTGLINLKSQGAAPLVQQLQAMQTAAENAAEATYQHEAAQKGDSAALQDAQDIFESMTGGALVQNAKQLGLTTDQAKKLADQYFTFDGKTVTTDVQAIGLNDINSTLDQLGQQLSYLTKVPWNISLNVSATANDIGKVVHDAVNNVVAAAPNQPSLTQHAAGGSLADGWFSVGEMGPERGFKSGSNVTIYPNGQSMAMVGASPSPSAQQPMVVTVQSLLDGKVIAQSTNEINGRNNRR